MTTELGGWGGGPVGRNRRTLKTNQTIAIIKTTTTTTMVRSTRGRIPWENRAPVAPRHGLKDRVHSSSMDYRAEGESGTPSAQVGAMAGENIGFGVEVMGGEIDRDHGFTKSRGDQFQFG